MPLSLAIAILDVNLKGPTATFDEMGLSAVRSAWLVVRATLPAESPPLRPSAESASAGKDSA